MSLNWETTKKTAILVAQSESIEAVVIDIDYRKCGCRVYCTEGPLYFFREA